MEKPFLETLAGRTPSRVPVWLMRQAGRYLPEYREVRARAGGFLNLAFDPDLACEVTMQPLRRFGFDAAILFSDILTVPLGLGRDVRFEAGEGPVLNPLTPQEPVPVFEPEKFDVVLAPVYETVRRIRAQLAKEGFTDTVLIGFAGAPWTVATYMIEGGSSRDFIRAKSWAYRDPQNFARLIDALTEATIHYLSQQVEAGAEALQLFDSWAGALDHEQFVRWAIMPAQKIAARLKQKYPHIPLIGFPRGAGAMLENYIESVEVAAVSLDPQIDPVWAVQHIQPRKIVQGNLDPLCLLAGGAALERAAANILETFGPERFIFNLGHGIHKDTPPEHVAMLVKQIRAA